MANISLSNRIGRNDSDGNNTVSVTAVDGVKPDNTGNVILDAYTPGNPPPSSGNGVPATWDAPGATAMLYYHYMSNAAAHSAGEEFSGSRFSDGCAYRDSTSGAVTFLQGSLVPAGTWRLQGHMGLGSTGESIVLAIRVDGFEMPVVAMRVTDQPVKVRNCQYATEDNRLIDCEVFYGGAWHPFTASPDDCTDYGPLIFETAESGSYGYVAPYSGTAG